MKKPTRIETPQQIMDIAAGFQQSRVLLTAHDLGVFTIIGDMALTAQEVAALAGTDERATDRLLAALAGMGLLDKGRETYRNTPASRRHLAADGEAPLGALGHLSRMYENWGSMTQAVRAGTSVIDLDFAPGSLEAFIQAMHSRAVQEARILVPHLPLSGARRVLDAGGGSGAIAMAVAEAAEEVEVTILDRPKVVDLAKQYTHDSPGRARIRFKPGDMLEDDFGPGWDGVLLMQILHMFGPEANRRLVAKAAAALAPGGFLAIQDFLLDDDRTTPPFASRFALNMLVSTRDGDAYTEAEVREWMRDAGLTDIVRHETDDRHALLVGVRPGGGA